MPSSALQSHRFETLTLSHSFRCGTRVTAWPMPFLRKPATPTAQSEGSGNRPTTVAKTGAIARTNAGVVQLAGQLASQGHKIWSPRPIDVRLI